MSEQVMERPARPAQKKKAGPPPVQPVFRRDLISLATMSRADLDIVFEQGRPATVEDVADREFDGYNHPTFASLLGIRKFRKGFTKTPDGLRGYNVKMVQNGGPMTPWRAVEGDDGQDVRHGFYLAEPAPDHSREPGSLLLDYGRGENPWYDPSALLRDYLRRVDAHSGETLLGRAYLALLGREVFVSYFLLQARA